MTCNVFAKRFDPEFFVYTVLNKNGYKISSLLPLYMINSWSLQAGRIGFKNGTKE